MLYNITPRPRGKRAPPCDTDWTMPQYRLRTAIIGKDETAEVLRIDITFDAENQIEALVHARAYIRSLKAASSSDYWLTDKDENLLWSIKNEANTDAKQPR